jgi:hypothetical protein
MPTAAHSELLAANASMLAEYSRAAIATLNTSNPRKQPPNPGAWAWFSRRSKVMACTRQHAAAREQRVCKITGWARNPSMRSKTTLAAPAKLRTSAYTRQQANHQPNKNDSQKTRHGFAHLDKVLGERAPIHHRLLRAADFCCSHKLHRVCDFFCVLHRDNAVTKLLDSCSAHLQTRAARSGSFPESTCPLTPSDLQLLPNNKYT